MTDNDTKSRNKSNEICKTVGKSANFTFLHIKSPIPEVIIVPKLRRHREEGEASLQSLHPPLVPPRWEEYDSPYNK